MVAGARAAARYEPVLSGQARRRFGVDPARLAPIAVVPTLACPIFVIGGGADRFTPPAETRAIYAAARGPKSLWIVSGLGHKGLSDTLSDIYRERVLAFVRDALGPAATST